MKTHKSDPAKLAGRKRWDRWFATTCLLAASFVVVILITLIVTIVSSASASLTFSTSLPRVENDTGISRYDGITRESRLRISIVQGTGPEGSTAEVQVRTASGEEMGIGTAQPRGDGSFVIPCRSLPDGKYSLWFVVTDEEGNELERSDAIPVIIDTRPPSKLTIDESLLGDRFLVSTEMDSFIVGGSGVEESAAVEIEFHDSSGNRLGPLPAKIKENQRWRTAPLSLQSIDANVDPRPDEGKIKIVATQKDLAGNVGPAIETTIQFNRLSERAADSIAEFPDENVDLTPLEHEVTRPTNVWTFLTSHHHDNAPEVSGVFRATIGSLLLCGIAALFTIPIGIGTAVFLEEFKPRNRILRAFHGFVQLNISNLAGVPSIVYGILGVTAFVYMFSLFPPRTVDTRPQFEFGTNYYYQLETLGGQYVTFPCTDRHQSTYKITEPLEVNGDEGPFELQVVDSTRGLSEEERYVSVRRGTGASIVDSEHSWFYLALPFGKSFLSAGLTLGLVVLPIVIIASQEAIRAVPDSLREASMGMGATKWQTVRSIVLPSATPGIMTGTILALSRAIGEAAPILAVMGGVLSVLPKNMMEPSSALPILIYKWAKDATKGFHSLSAAAIVVLLLLLLLMNSVAIVIRYRAERKNK